MKRIISAIAMLMMVIATTVAATTTTGLMTEQPEGTLKVYDRAGYSYYVNSDYIRRGAQTGTVSIVFAADNSVYIKDPLAKVNTGVWVKGTLSADGKTITLPLGQVIAHDTESNDDVILGTLEYDDEEEEVSTKSTSSYVTYSIDAAGTIKLVGTSKYVFLGVVWKKTNYWAEYGDYSSVYTEKKSEDEPVTPPAGLVTSKMKFSANSYVAEKSISYNTFIGFDGEDVYVKGIYADLPEVWIKGKKSGNKLTFPSGQYLAPTKTGTTNYYMIAVARNNTSNIQDFVLNYNETTGEYTNADQFLVLNTAKKTVYLVEAYSDIMLQPIGDAYDVPFIGTFNGSLGDFTVIDANNDKVTWIANKMNSTAEYNWSLTNQADDWLITPKINLEAGKNYIFTVKARSMAGLLEKLEVKAGKEATVASMTKTIMPVTEIKTSDFKDFQALVAVEENGAYHFGVHAVSDKDNNGLYIQEIRVDDIIDGITDVNAASATPVFKYVKDGKVIVVKNNKQYNITGVEE